MKNEQGITLMLLSFWLGLLWSASIKPLNAPDEVAHLQAIMQVRKQYVLPSIHYGKLTNAATPIGNTGDQAVRDYAISLGRTDAFMLTAYESTQPPLYYLTVGLLAQAIAPEPKFVLYLARLVSVLFGAGTVYFCWAATRQFAPRSPVWAVAAAGAVALMPQFSFNSATAANDAAVAFAGACAYYVWFRGLREPEYDRLMLKAGAMMGIGLLAKLTALVLGPGLALVILFRAFQAREPETKSKWRARIQRLMRMGVGAAAGTFAVSGWFLIRNILTYGEPSGMADTTRIYMANFNKVVLEDPASVTEFLRSTWHSIWGMFGWMDISLPTELYEQAGLVTVTLFGLSAIAALLTAGRWLYLSFKNKGVPAHIWQSILVMIAVGISLVLAYVEFNRTVAFQAQGRYLFLLLLPAALVFTGGLHTLAPWRPLKVALLSLPLIWLAYLNAIGLILAGR